MSIAGDYLMEVRAPWLIRLRAEVIDPLRDEIARHPFVTGALAGTVPLPAIRRYLSGLLWNITGFPECVAALASRTPKFDHDTKRLLLQNAAAEVDHPLALGETLRAIGGDPEPLLHGPVHAFDPPTAWFDHHSLLELYAYQRPWIEGIAAINVGIEALVPAQIGPLGRALRERYGVPAAQMTWFQWHGGEVEQEHGNDGLRLLDRYVRPDDVETQVQCAYAVKRIGSMLARELPDDALSAS